MGERPEYLDAQTCQHADSGALSRPSAWPEDLSPAELEMVKLLDLLVQALGSDQTRSHVSVMRSEGRLLFEVCLEPDDRARLIGHRGQVVKAIRTILIAIGGKSEVRFALNLTSGAG